MDTSHAAGWASDSPTPAQIKELFAQVESRRVTKDRLQEFLREPAKSASHHDWIQLTLRDELAVLIDCKIDSRIALYNGWLVEKVIRLARELQTKNPSWFIQKMRVVPHTWMPDKPFDSMGVWLVLHNGKKIRQVYSWVSDYGGVTLKKNEEEDRRFSDLLDHWIEKGILEEQLQFLGLDL